MCVCACVRACVRMLVNVLVCLNRRPAGLHTCEQLVVVTSLQALLQQLYAFYTLMQSIF